MKNLTINLGDYVRTTIGEIGKIIDCPEQLKQDYGNWLWLEKKEEQRPIRKEDIKTSSQNIIDLIEVGDYVNGEEVNFADVIETWGNEKYCWTETGSISSRSIYSIVTKEQFEAMEYKIER